MMTGMRFVVVLLLLLAVVAGGAWVVAARGGPPVIQIQKPDRFLGQAGELDVIVITPGGALSEFEVQLEQDGRVSSLFSSAGTEGATFKQEAPDRVRVTREVRRRDVPGLKSGPARVTVRASRTVLSGWRTLASSASKDVQVRLEPPRVAVVSTHHFVNHAGAEMVVYRTGPANVESGVRVGDVTYPGYPLSAAGVDADPSLKLAFFAILFDQDLGTPVQVFARDEAGNRATSTLDVKVFPKPFRRSRIDVTPAFLQRVVPAILDNTPDFTVEDPDDLLQAFLRINGELRRQNAATIAEFARQSAPEMLWQGAFQQLGNSAVQSLFADHRTYMHEGREVDQQVHLGFDLAVTAAVPIVAANRGRVVSASYLGIYGNCVILDHGLGVQSLYAHLSSIDVSPGDLVERGAVLGRSGMTGLAGGDHLHFTMLVNGIPVNAVEWWDSHWMEDRVYRKIREATAPAPGATATSGVGASAAIIGS
jgi:murein DD-endopeptidase MepM/ murein hydrolase activator NlpD